MTPKEKAEELFVKFNKEGLHQISSVITRSIRKEIIKQCALVAVDEVLDHVEMVGDEAAISYWIQVKEELWKL